MNENMPVSILDVTTKLINKLKNNEVQINDSKALEAITSAFEENKHVLNKYRDEDINSYAIEVTKIEVLALYAIISQYIKVFNKEFKQDINNKINVQLNKLHSYDFNGSIYFSGIVFFWEDSAKEKRLYSMHFSDIQIVGLNDLVELQLADDDFISDLINEKDFSIWTSLISSHHGISSENETSSETTTIANLPNKIKLDF